MLITCEKCSTRYQLADDKIRPTGTKVRCPRCQHTFRVFNKTAAEPPSMSPPPPPPAAKPLTERPKREKFSDFRTAAQMEGPESEATEFSDRSLDTFKVPAFEEDQNTRIVSDDEERTLRQKSARAPDLESDETKTAKSPFGGKSKKIKESPFKAPTAPESVPAELSANLTGMKDEQRPFGDATFAAIQEMNRPKANHRKLMLLGFVFVLAGLFFFSVKQILEKQPETVSSPVTPPQSPKVLVYRPDSWYRDDLRTIQSTLALLAGLPDNEREKPEYRSTLAEALVLNGTLNSSNDQVVSGLNLASRLVASDPQSVYGLYALATNAFYKSDLETIADLKNRWPSGNRGDPEYRLLEIIALKSSGQPELSVTRLKELMTDYPDFQRAQLTALQMVVDFPEIADRIIGARKIEILRSSFERYRNNLKQMAGLIPSYHKELEKKLERVEKPKVEAPVPPPAASVPEPVAKTPPAKEKSALVETTPPVSKKPTPEKRPARKTLPKQAEDLVAANRETRRERSEAEKLLDKGNDLYAEKKFDEAMTAYNQALRLNPDLAEAYRQMGVIYMNSKQSDRALVSFKIYLQLRPDSSDRRTVEGWITSLK